MNAYSHKRTMDINTKPLRGVPQRLRLAAAGFAALVLGWPVLAFADCVDDDRKPTASETDFYNRAIAALVAALPPVPAGATLGSGGDDFNRLPTIGLLCGGPSGHKIGEFDLRAQRFYVLKDQKAAVRLSINVTKLPVTATVPFGAFGAASPGRSAGMKVNNVVWSVGGTDTPLRQTLTEAIDRAYLQALVGNPLPAVAESRARAAQASPAVAGSTTAAPAVTATPAPNAPATQTATQPPASPPPAPAGQAGASEPIKDAVDTVNKLRGLFGR